MVYTLPLNEMLVCTINDAYPMSTKWHGEGANSLPCRTSVKNIISILLY